MNPSFDLVLRNGLVFDGTGSPAVIRHVGVREGRVVAMSATPLDESRAREVIDATGLWVVPGFVDTHTHYDAEVLVAPGLEESVRHGVTSVVFGSCSLSTIHATPLDIADLFSRVEAVPREHVLHTLETKKTWHTAAEYIAALEELPLGPNVAAFLGHSDVRAHVMGLGRSVDGDARPTTGEMTQMETLLEEALDAGLLGLSSMTTPWDKLDGDRFRSRSLPSTYATWREFRKLHAILRRRKRVLQSAPNVTTKVNVLAFLATSMGLSIRSPLRTTLLTAADAKSQPGAAFVLTSVARLVNRFLGADFKWQHLPVPFEVYADGIDLVVFEEFGAGRAALHLKDHADRVRLFSSESFRDDFRRDYDKRFTARVWQRDFHDAQIVACPDASVVGKSFGQVADERNVHPVDAFLDLVTEHGEAVRWRTTIANHRSRVLEYLGASDGVHMGFADSGAHLRNMAFYNFPLRFLRRVKDAADAGRPFLTIERAVHRLTGELADWYGLDAGTLREGDRADAVLIDPRGLDASLDEYHEAPIPEFGGISRMVNRSDRAVSATIVGGQVVFRAGAFTPGFGRTRRTGRFLRAGEGRGTVDAATLATTSATHEAAVPRP